MAADIKLKGAARATVIDDNATLANNARAAGDYNNDTGLNLFCTAYLQVQYDAGPPAAGAEIARLYVLPGDDESSEIFPDGGDAGLGTDDTPQQVFYVGSFESINPSTSVNEILAIPGIPLTPGACRFVILNVSGQTFDLTWELRIKPYLLQSV